MNLSAWLKEFKRRRVFRALAGYGLVAFALLQVVEPVMHGLDLPEWTLKVVVVGLGLGLPITIVLAWAYDINPAGIERTDPELPAGGGAWATGRAWRTLALVAIGLLLAAPVVSYYLVFRDRAPAGSGTTPAAGRIASSVAVLPFVNMSDDPGNEYFSDGLSEEILNRLAQIPGLHVPARTSSFAFKGRSEDVGKIGAALRVGAVLEGSVRKAGGRVRVTAQLVNAADGYHLWSQSFDRELKDVFAIQDEISEAIATALKVRLAPTTGGAVKQAGSTTNTDAYEAYLLGRHGLNERTRKSIEGSIAHFERAVALDPGFALAYADLAVAHLLLGRGGTSYGDVPVQETIARARPLLDKARALAPERSEVLAAVGFMESQAGHEARALEYYDRALAINPSNGELHNWRKIALESLGRCDQILAASAAAVKSDPLSKIALINYVPVLQSYGRSQEIGPIVERLRGLDEPWGQWALGWLAMGRGDRAEAVRHLLPAMQQGRDKAAQDLATILASLGLRQEALRLSAADPLTVHLLLGDYTRAMELARSASRQDPASPEVMTGLFAALYGAGRTGEAAPLAARLWETGQAAGNPALLVVMADVARAAGRAAEATRYADRARQQLGLCERSGVAGVHLDGGKAMLAAFEGRDDEAVALLSGVLPTFVGSRSLLELPLASRLARRPDFRAALKRFDGILAGQRAQVLDLLCGPNRVAPTWQPAPGTCALMTLAR